MKISDRYHAAVETLVGTTLPRGDLRHFLSAENTAEADAVLAKAGVDLGKPLLGMSPGANWTTKRWPHDRYGEIATRARDLGYTVIATGSADESASSRACGNRARRGQSVRKAFARRARRAIVRCRAFVANDSGPMHMSRALGVPTLTFFGSTDPKQFEFEGHAVLFAGVECSPCSFFGLAKCPQGHFRCMLDLSAESAWSALEPLLKQGRVGFIHA